MDSITTTQSLVFSSCLYCSLNPLNNKPIDWDDWWRADDGNEDRDSAVADGVVEDDDDGEDNCIDSH